jgi:hypothetical protein
MRKTVIIHPKWARGMEYKIQATIRNGLFLDALTISKKCAKYHGLNATDMGASDFYLMSGSQYVKIIQKGIL